MRAVAAIGMFLLVSVLAIVIGFAFATIPCYVFPLFGGNAKTWCGFKSEPTYFFVEFWTGFVVTWLVAWHLRRRRRGAVRRRE